MDINHLKHLINRSIFDLYFDVKQPISVGSGTEGNIRKIAILIKDEGLVPFVPAESVKGTMRSLARRLFPEYNCDKGEHYSGSDVNITERELDILQSVLHERQIEELSDKVKMNLIRSLRCAICRLFGSKMLCGKLLFNDMYPLGYKDVMTYTSNSINRKTMTVEQNRLFTAEYIMPEGMYLRIIADNLGREEKILISSLLRWISDIGFEVGGLKSRGYGLLLLNKERSSIKILKLNEVKDENDIINNVRAMLLRQGYYDELNIEEYVDAI